MKIGQVFNMGWGLFTARVLRRKIPLNVMFSITNRCTARCSYCDIPARKQRELTSKEVFSLIDQIRKLGCRRLGIWGGEPLLREDIAQVINYAKDRDLFVTLDTNGDLLPEKIHLLGRLDHLLLAFDGDQNAHDLNRGAGSFQRVMKAMDTAHGKIPFWTITVITKNNLCAIDFILAQAERHGFLTTFQLLHHNDHLAADYKSLLPSAEESRKVIKKLITEKRRGAPIASGLKYLEHILNWPDYSEIYSSSSSNGVKCWAGDLYCNVDTDGSVYPCSLLVGKKEALNFLDAGFKEAFAFADREACAQCLGACFTEYNYLYSWDFRTIFEWLRSFKRTKSHK